MVHACLRVPYSNAVISAVRVRCRRETDASDLARRSRALLCISPEKLSIIPASVRVLRALDVESILIHDSRVRDRLGIVALVQTHQVSASSVGLSLSPRYAFHVKHTAISAVRYLDSDLFCRPEGCAQSRAQLGKTVQTLIIFSAGSIVV